MPPTTQGPQDPKILAVVKAIRSVETGPNGDYENRSGDNGSSAGAYQWNNDNKPLAPGELPSHWKSAAQQFLGDSNAPMTRENQNKVAYSQVEAYQKQGLSPLEIDALWNGAHKDEGGKYVHNNPQRATEFQQALQQQIQGGIPQGPAAVGGMPQMPQAVGAPQQEQQAMVPTQAPEGLGSSLLHGASNFLSSAEKPFIGAAAIPVQALASAMGKPDPYAQGIPTGIPATGDTSQVTPLQLEQKAGDIAQVGSYFIPGSEGVIPTLAGAGAMGALQGAGSAMSQGADLPTVAGQGVVGGALGAGLAGGALAGGAALRAAGDTLSGAGAAKATQGIKDAYSSALNLNASSRAFENRTGKDLAQVLMDHNAPLGRYEDGTLDASQAIPILQKKLEPLNKEAESVLGSAKGSVNLFDAASDAKKAVDVKNLPALDRNHIADKINKYIQAEVDTRAEQMAQDTYGMGLDAVTPQQKSKILYDAANPTGVEADKIKASLWNAVGKGFDRDTELGNNATYQLGHSIKEAIENAFPKERIGEINAERGDLIDAIRRLTKMDGVQKIKGGQLGNMMGGVTGAIAGAASGLGPFGAMAGDYFGTKATEFMNNPATKIGTAKLSAKAQGAIPSLIGSSGRAVGKGISAAGRGVSKGARGVGLIGNLLAK